jgi:CxxC motif-containing protein (DUF1111 family)
MMKTITIAVGLVTGLFAIPGCPVPPPDAPPGAPLKGLNEEQRAQFEQGRDIFERVFVPEDGLGPLFNATGCATCHAQPVTGGAGAIAEVHFSRFGPQGCDPLFEVGGPVVQQNATPALQALGINGEVVPDIATGEGLRSTPPVFGLGLIDAIPEESILAREDPDDRDGDGISGRANRFIDGRLGRFGRKAFIPALLDFNAGALPIEQGITTPFSPVEETINGQPIPEGTDPAPDPEISIEDIGLLNDFVRFLAPPEPLAAGGYAARKRVALGEKLFRKIGCASCHVPELETGENEVAALHKRRVALYSDLLLHDMGPELADICLGLAEPSEFRTELLMGLRFRDRFLHDGSASTLEEAIGRHGGEAAQSRAAYAALGARKKAALIEFLRSI